MSSPCVAVCCSLLQCVAVCCSVLQRVALWCTALQCMVMCCSVWHGDEAMQTSKCYHVYGSSFLTVCSIAFFHVFMWAQMQTLTLCWFAWAFLCTWVRVCVWVCHEACVIERVWVYEIPYVDPFADSNSENLCQRHWNTWHSCHHTHHKNGDEDELALPLQHIALQKARRDALASVSLVASPLSSASIAPISPFLESPQQTPPHRTQNVDSDLVTSKTINSSRKGKVPQGLNTQNHT